MSNHRVDTYGPRRSDPSHPSAARIYDAALGGHHNYRVDREALEKIKAAMPYVVDLARHNRRWVRRVVRYLVTECGIRQFLDIGSGIPGSGNVHEIAQGIEPTSRVIYVDYDNVAIDKASEILEHNPYVAALHRDVRLPDTILHDPRTESILDFEKPVAMIWAAMLHFVEDQDDPVGLFRRYAEVLAPGSYIALSHATPQSVNDENLERQRNQSRDRFNQLVTETVTHRDVKTIMGFFDNARAQLVEPGLVPLPDWRPTQDYRPDVTDIAQSMLVGGVARIV